MSTNETEQAAAGFGLVGYSVVKPTIGGPIKEPTLMEKLREVCDRSGQLMMESSAMMAKFGLAYPAGNEVPEGFSAPEVDEPFVAPSMESMLQTTSISMAMALSNIRTIIAKVG